MDDIGKIREFNRLYAKLLCLFSRYALNTEFSMLEARIIGEVGRNKGCTANSISKYLNLDRSYLSRIIEKFEKNGLIVKEQNKEDSRKKSLYLTDEGYNVYLELEDKSDQQIKTILNKVKPEEIKELVKSMNKITEILGVEDIRNWNI